MQVSQEEFEEFDRELRKAFQRVGEGKVAVDSNSVRAVVRLHKAAAYRYVELHCVMASSQPGYLQPALLVAGAYQVEFNDATLMELVLKRAKDLNAMEHLQSVGFARSMADIQNTPPKTKGGSTIVVPCNGPDGKPCSLIQINDVTEQALRKGIRGRCPKCGKEFRVDAESVHRVHVG